MSALAKKVFELFGKPETVAEVGSKPAEEPSTISPSWSCPKCGGHIQLEPADDNAPSRFWTCSSCGTWGATRDGATSPVVWVSRTGMQ